jgi:hypothetical protein
LACDRAGEFENQAGSTAFLQKFGNFNIGDFLSTCNDKFSQSSLIDATVSAIIPWSQQTTLDSSVVSWCIFVIFVGTLISVDEIGMQALFGRTRDASPFGTHLLTV